MSTETPAPFKSARMNRMNDAAAKFDTPFWTVLYRAATTVGAVLFAVAAYAGQKWLDERIDTLIAKNPVVYNVGTKLDEVTKQSSDVVKKVEVNERTIATLSATQEKVSTFLRENLKTQQAISLQLGVLTQKVDDGQKHAEDAVVRIDRRLDDLSRPR